MVHRAFRVAYDGRAFHGFQRQPDVPTIEGMLFRGLDELAVMSGTKPPHYTAAGRTDAGVSAVAQTIAMECPEWLSPRAFNSVLPSTIRVWASTTVPPSFHATCEAHAREYTYFLATTGADDALAQAVAERLSGTHPVHNLTPDPDPSPRRLETSVARVDEWLRITVRAPGFDRHLVRRIVGLIDAVVHGDRSLADVGRVCSAERLTGPDGVPTAPAEPLVLTAVRYPSLTFTPDQRAVGSALDAFEAVRQDRRTHARIARTMCRSIE